MRYIQAFENKPDDFLCQVQVAACYLQVEGKSLFLQYSERKSEPGRWGVPAGKCELNEPPQDAAIRELFEETGIKVAQGSDVRPIGVLFMRKEEIDYEYHLFEIRLSVIPKVVLSDEHQDFCWKTAGEFESLPLMTGAKEGFLMYQKAISCL